MVLEIRRKLFVAGKKQLKFHTKSVVIHPKVAMVGYYPDDRQHSNAVQAFELLDVHIAFEETVKISFDRECGQNITAPTGRQFFVLSG